MSSEENSNSNNQIRGNNESSNYNNKYDKNNDGDDEATTKIVC